MTSIRMNIGKKDMFLVLTGHAGYKHGDDIVCAALSVLGEAAVATVFGMQQEYGVHAWATMEPGVLKLEAEYPDGVQREVESRLALAQNGFQMLEHAYPEHVKCHFLAVQTKKLGM